LTEPNALHHEIGPARAADMEAVKGLLAGASLPLEGLDEAAGSLLVARSGDRLTGAVAMEEYGKDVLLRSLVVTAEGRKGGLGSRLVVSFMERARRLGKARVYLLTVDAQPFFERHGFVEIPGEQIPAAMRASPEFDGCQAIGASTMVFDLLGPEPDRAALREQVRRKYAGAAPRPKPAGGCCCSKPAGAPKG
jgi:amino-acid N-acetyltransferase